MRMSNGKIVRIFTSQLSGLCASGVSLKESFVILKDLKGNDRKIRLLYAEILYSLESGSNFSMALRKCQNAFFSRWYIGFVEVAEESGDIEKTLEFLNSTLESRHRNNYVLFENFLYPAFLIVLASAFGILLERFFKTGNFLRAFLFLANVCVWILFAVKRVFEENPMTFFLRAMSFLWERKIPLERSLESASVCISYNQKLFSAVAKIKDEILNGRNVAESFEKNLSKAKFTFSAKILGLNLALHSAGNMANPYEKSLAVIKADEEKRKKIFLRVEQPLLLAVAAIFILMIVGNLGFLYEVQI